MPYDPEHAPSAAEWLAMDEAERIAAVEAYHRRQRVQLPQPRLRLHAAIHVVVENQIALGEVAAPETLARLQSEGLTRHEGIHAIGMVVAEHVADLVKRVDLGADPTAAYRERLGRLTAEAWRQSADADAP